MLSSMDTEVNPTLQMIASVLGPAGREWLNCTAGMHMPAHAGSYTHKHMLQGWVAILVIKKVLG